MSGMKDHPIYTIAIPAFKSTFLKKCIESVLSQTHSNFELIIVNDASPEPIDELVSQFSDPRIRYYKNSKNAGAEFMVQNWNKCLELARGDYFILLGDDDLLDKDYLESFEALIRDYPALNVYHCRSKIVDTDGNTIDITPPWPSYENVYDNMYYRLNMSRIQYVSDFVYKTDALKAKGGFFYLPLAWGSDDITSFMAASDKGIAHCNKPVFNYRESSLTITRSGDALKKMEAVLLQAQWLTTFLAEKPKEPLEILSHQKLCAELADFLLRRKADIIKDALRSRNTAGLLYWLKKAGQYQVPKQLVLRIYVALWREQHIKGKK